MKKIPAAQVHAVLSKHYPPHVLGWVKRATWHAHPGVPLSRIDMARRPGARDPQKVAGIAEAVNAGKPMPSVVLVNTGDAKLQIADGYHRTLGFQHAGKSKIPALIASGVGAHGPWEKRMHAAKLNLTACGAARHVIDLAGVCTGPGPCDTTPFGSGDNWVNKVGGLPLYIRAIAKALRRSGHSESSAIATAVATVKRWAAGGGGVTPETRARAAAALAEWERKKTQAHSLTAAGGATVDLASVIASTDGPSITYPARMTAASKGQALPGGRFPIRNHSDLRKAVRAVGRAKGDHAQVRRFIIRRANAIGGQHLIPDHWHADGTIDMTAEASAVLDLAFTEALHPRGKKGTAQGGRFVAKNSSGGTGDMQANTRDFQRRTGLKQTGQYDKATAGKVDALTGPKSGGGSKSSTRGKKRKGGTSSSGTTAKQTAAQRRTTAARTAVAINKLSPAQRELYRAKHPAAPAGYRWNAAGLLVPAATSSAARMVRAILARP